MNETLSITVSLTSEWFILPGREQEVLSAVAQLALKVEQQEPSTLVYLVHHPRIDTKDLQSLPPQVPQKLLFFEVYRDANAFLRHLNGPLFTQFVADYGNCFISAHGSPYTTVQFLTRHAGFMRVTPITESSSMQASTAPSANQHPAVMFEIIANDQDAVKAFYAKVFGWTYQSGSSGFAYVHFPMRGQPLLGGIAQADPTVPGFAPGRNFYLLVDELEPAIARALAAGGTPYMPIAAVDGYRFAMIQDIEGNPVGLIEPFAG
jgi:predicted enzyme related to lactoylglutathione lyase/quinol monooxygenase YgiN